MINCNLKKNLRLDACKRRAGEGHFTMILPKADNSGRKIKPQVYKKYINRINKNFGGSTIKPITLGCWRDEKRKRMQCETGFAVETFRDFESSGLSDLNSSQRTKKLEQDHKFMQKVGRDVAKELGQDSVPVIYDNISEVSLEKGEFKKRIANNKVRGRVNGDIFDNNI